MLTKPIIVVFAGPNGSGKSTVFLTHAMAGQYINADEIKKILCCTDLEAAEKAKNLREDCLQNLKDFTFETVLSKDRNLKLLNRAKKSGYFITGIFVLTKSPELNVARVKARVRNGGHPVPEEKVRSRYYQAIANLPTFVKLCDECLVYDNSKERAELIFQKAGKSHTIHETSVWNKTEIRKLISP